MLYKLGDKVKIRSDLISMYNSDPSRKYYGICKNGEKTNMCIVLNKQKIKYSGMIVTIDRVMNGFYKIKEDDRNWYWTDEMFENNGHLCYFESLI